MRLAWMVLATFAYGGLFASSLATANYVTPTQVQWTFGVLAAIVIVTGALLFD